MTTNPQNHANRLSSPYTLSMSPGEPADLFMQNKPNLQEAQMNIISVLTKNYENSRLVGRGKNKPKQTQFTE
jgi:hypothetical protein